jgi:hypothetical protein
MLVIMSCAVKVEINQSYTRFCTIAVGSGAFLDTYQDILGMQPGLENIGYILLLLPPGYPIGLLLENTGFFDFDFLRVSPPRFLAYIFTSAKEPLSVK